MSQEYEKNLVDNVVENMENPLEVLNNAMQTLSMDKLVGSFDKLHNELSSLQKIVIPDEEHRNLVTEQVKTMTDEELKDISDDRVADIFKGLTVNKANKSENIIDVQKDYLLLERECQKIVAEATKSKKERDTMLKEHGKEIMENQKSIKDILKKSMDAAKEEATKNRYRDMINAYDEVDSLDTVYDVFSKLKPSNQLDDYRRRYVMTREKFHRLSQKLKITIDVGTFLTIEKDHLPEKYHVLLGFFVFLIQKFIIHRSNPTRRWEGTFCLAMHDKLKCLDLGELKGEEREAFLNNVMKLLDLFIDE